MTRWPKIASWLSTPHLWLVVPALLWAVMVQAQGTKKDAGDLLSKVSTDLPSDTFAIALVVLFGALG